MEREHTAPKFATQRRGSNSFRVPDGVLQLPDHPLRVRKLLAKLGGRNEPITYWITVGERVALSGPEQKLAQLSYSTRGIVPDGMLVRVSSIDADAQRAYGVQGEFVSEMASAIRPDLRPQVIGR